MPFLHAPARRTAPASGGPARPADPLDPPLPAKGRLGISVLACSSSGTYRISPAVGSWQDAVVGCQVAEAQRAFSDHVFDWRLFPACLWSRAIMVRDAYELGARARQHHMCGRADSRLALVLAHSASQHFLGERPAHPADQKRPARARVLGAALALMRGLLSSKARNSTGRVRHDAMWHDMMHYDTACKQIKPPNSFRFVRKEHRNRLDYRSVTKHRSRVGG